MKNEIKKIIADILYLNSTDDIKDNASLFTELGLSSLDYIDLCFELKRKFNLDETKEDLWPVNKMILDKKLFDNLQWTDDGWRKVCHLIGINPEKEKLPVQKLYQFFTVNYLENRLRS